MRNRGLSKEQEAEMAHVAERILKIKFEWKKPVTTDGVKKYLQEFLYPYTKEVFGCVFLDQKHHPICVCTIYCGRKNSIIVDPEKVVEKALEYEAAAVIAFHCCNTLELTPAEKTLFLLLVDFLSDIQVSVYDHILVCEQGHLSFAEQGLLLKG